MLIFISVILVYYGLEFPYFLLLLYGILCIQMYYNIFYTQIIFLVMIIYNYSIKNS